MKIILSNSVITNEETKYEAINFIKSLLMGIFAVHGSYIRDYDFKIRYNEVYKFYDISIYRDARATSGNGTVQYRENKWIEIKSLLDKLFLDLDKEYTWRWAKHHRLELSGPTDMEEIPGVRICIPVDYEINF